MQQLVHTIQTDPPTLLDLEQCILAEGKEPLLSLLTGLLPLFLPVRDAPELPCSCGALASYQRDRPAQVLTLLGSLRMQLCAGSVSTGLEALSLFCH